MAEKLEENKPYRFRECFKPKLMCHCNGEVVMRLVLTRHIEKECYIHPNSPVGGPSRGSVTEIISPTLEFTTYCEDCALRYDLERIEEMRGIDITEGLRRKYAKKYNLRIE